MRVVSMLLNLDAGKCRGKLFHYTCTPNKLTSGRDAPNEVAKRLRQAGIVAAINGDGILAVKM